MDLKGAVVIGGRTHKGGGDGYGGIIADNNDKNVELVWNNGKEDICTFDDIFVVDLGPTGISHDGVKCDACAMIPIVGTRWKCALCNDFDLCSSCYHGNMHEVSHPFYRIDIPRTPAVNVGKRQLQERKKKYGFYPGAKVKRGRDWDWGQQDGGDGNIGKVVSVYDWKGPFGKKSVRSGVSVLWNKQKNENNYRTGFQGKMDLICVTPAFGEHYYKNHLPTLAAVIKGIPQKRDKKFNVGDIVTINKSVETLMQLQDGHGGFLRDMIDCIGLVGHVLEMMPTGDFLVLFDVNKDNTDSILVLLLQVKTVKRRKWVINPAALKKVENLPVNEKVKVINDENLLALMQKNVGVYKQGLEKLAGHEGVVLKPFDGETIQVKFGDSLSVGMSVAALNEEKEEEISQADLVVGLLRLFKETLEESEEEQKVKANQKVNTIEEIQDKDIVTTVYEGDLAGVRKILTEKPHMINAFKNGKSSLHVALIQGNEDIIKLLLEFGADTSLESDDGDTALHFAVASNLIATGRLMIRRGCPRNSKNKAGFTGLHTAVLNENTNFVRMLVSEKCDPNVKDHNGNTAVHEACEKGNATLAEILLSSPSCDISVFNQKGFNALHYAALKGQLTIVQTMLQEYPEAVNMPKEDGFTVFHIAIVNGMEDIVNFILTFYAEGGLNLELKTKSGQTPLHLACVEGFLSIVKVLLNHGAKIDAESKDGETATHLCVFKHHLLCSLPQQLQAWELYPDIATVRSRFENSQASGIVIACFLLENGASISYMNHNGRTVLDACEDTNLKKLLLEFSQKSREVVGSPTSGKPPVKLLSEVSIDMCPMCSTDNPIEGRFQPCGHALLCFDHADCMKRCPECKKPIENVTRLSIERLPNCMICRDVRVNVTFQPCGHQIACYECGKRFRVCLQCDTEIKTKVPIGEIPKEEVQGASSSDDSNESHLCNICFERRRNSIFLCGHGACKKCAYVLRDCHICRKKIERIIETFDN